MTAKTRIVRIGNSRGIGIPKVFQHRSGYVVLDQLRTVDRERLVERLGALPGQTLTEVLGALQEMFAK